MKIINVLIVFVYTSLLLGNKNIDTSNEVISSIILGDSIPKFDISFSVVQVSPPDKYIVHKEPTFIQKMDSLTFTLKHNTVSDSNITVSKKYVKNIKQYYEPMEREIPGQYVTLLYDYNNGLSKNYEIIEKNTIRAKSNGIILRVYDKSFDCIKTLNVEKNDSFDANSLIDYSRKEVILYIRVESL